MLMYSDWYDDDNEVFKYIDMRYKKVTYQNWFGAFCDSWDILALGFNYTDNIENDNKFDMNFTKDDDKIYIVLSSDNMMEKKYYGVNI